MAFDPLEHWKYQINEENMELPPKYKWKPRVLNIIKTLKPQAHLLTFIMFIEIQFNKIWSSVLTYNIAS